jgi:hypothetical protein
MSPTWLPVEPAGGRPVADAPQPYGQHHQRLIAGEKTPLSVARADRE